MSDNDCPHCGTGYSCNDCEDYICGHISNLHSITCAGCSLSFCSDDGYDLCENCRYCSFCNDYIEPEEYKFHQQFCLKCKKKFCNEDYEKFCKSCQYNECSVCKSRLLVEELLEYDNEKLCEDCVSILCENCECFHSTQFCARCKRNIKHLLLQNSKKHYEAFLRNIEEIKLLVKTVGHNLDKNLRISLCNSMVIALVTSLEVFLKDFFETKISQKKIRQILLKNIEKREIKIMLKDIYFTDINDFRKKYEDTCIDTYIEKIRSFQNIKEVHRIYSKCFKMGLEREEIEKLQKIVRKRNQIVHINNFKEGSFISTNIEGLLNDTKIVVECVGKIKNRIDKALKK
ncbi:HEPN domain-containing protein [Candidatus Uabimicrobium sp. HlEnr_7]|uniref:HEPN domain-containing protein n=1 Tax=Candidatus Uabimicrobium helgolandensis TaxID=3095367 RepID=UPI003558C57E